MSALSDLLNRHFKKKYGDTSNRRIAEQAGVSRGTIDNYRKGDHPARPSEEILSAFHEMLGIPMARLREVAGLPPGEDQPYTPPSEANLLDNRQRLAVDELIRSIVATKRSTDEDQSQTSAPADPPTDGEAGANGAPMNVSFLDDQRAPDVDDMLERVTAEAKLRESEGDGEGPLPFRPEEAQASRPGDPDDESAILPEDDDPAT